MKIKNWEKFQHYHTGRHADKPPEWIKVYPRKLLNDIEWNKLSDTDKATMIELWMLASEYAGELPDIETVCFRLRRTEKQIKSTLSTLSRHWLDDVYTESSPEEEIEKEENKKENENKTRESEHRFWAIYPHKVGKAPALKALSSALRKASIEEICAGVERYVATKPPDRQWCNPATWLNQERWLDMPSAIGAPQNPTAAGFQRAFARIRAHDAAINGSGSAEVVDLSEVRHRGAAISSAPCDVEPSD